VSGTAQILCRLLPWRTDRALDTMIAVPLRRFTVKLKLFRETFFALLVATSLFSATTQAGEGQESSVATVGKSTFYGALTGLLVGGAAALVGGGNSGDILKWSFVAGTSVGLIWGIHDASTGPERNSAMFSLKSDGSTTFALPTPQLRAGGDGDFGVGMTVFSLSF
jgi:hypothetical protein